MKLHEIIVLNDKEYTVELNRETALAIDRYINMNKSMKIVYKNLYEYLDDKKIESGENPFDNVIDEEDILKQLEEKEKQLKLTFAKAFWIWLYPVHKLDYDEVYKIIESYTSDEKKSSYIAEKYSEFLDKSINVRKEFIKEQKKLKAQIMKN